MPASLLTGDGSVETYWGKPCSAPPLGDCFVSAGMEARSDRLFSEYPHRKYFFPSLRLKYYLDFSTSARLCQLSSVSSGRSSGSSASSMASGTGTAQAGWGWAGRLR